MTSDTAAKWYLLQCKPRQELRAQENLGRQGYHCFAPVISSDKIRKGKRVSVTEPLFPGYLFIQLDRINDNWAPIRSTLGVSRIVAFNGAPTSVPQGVIERLLRAASQDSEVRQTLTPGDSLQLSGGPFKELDVIFHSYNGEERVFVLLNIMQQQHKLSIPIKDLKAP